MPPNVYNWIISFLTRRVQSCEVQDIVSRAIGINLSVVQGSGIGQSLYVIMESDLHPKSRNNKLMKYADDTNLLVPENTKCTLSEKFDHIKDWAKANKMVINMSKSKELVFYRPYPSRSHMSPIEQVKIAKLLGVVLSGNLNFDEHVSNILSICSQRLYLIKLLRSQGMPESKLHVIFVALIVSRICYALSAWGRFLNSQ